MHVSPPTPATRGCATPGGPGARNGLFAQVTLWCSAGLASTTPRPGGHHHGRDRGDVPGWVMITLMTSGLVIALWAVAGDRLAALFTQALDAVTKIL